jgi:hypothetical protein
LGVRRRCMQGCRYEEVLWDDADADAVWARLLYLRLLSCTCCIKP